MIEEKVANVRALDYPADRLELIVACDGSPDATPERARAATRERVLLHGDLPSPQYPPSGCVFRTRCPKAQDRCAAEVPEVRQVDSGSHQPEVVVDSHATAHPCSSSPRACGA